MSGSGGVVSPLLLGAVLLGMVAHASLLAALLVLVLLLAARLGPRLSLSLAWPGQGGLLVVAAGLAALLTVLLVPPPASDAALLRFWAGLASWALLGAASRLACAAPLGGPVWTYLLGLVALLACGQTHAGPWYTAATFGYLLLSLVAVRWHDPGRTRFQELPRRRRLLALALPLASALAAWLLTLPLLPLSRAIEQRVMAWYLPEQSRVGFSDRLQLGALEGMLDSDEVVLRLYGPPVDYLRGIAYNRYQGGRWLFDSTAPQRMLVVGQGRPASRGVTEMRRVAVEDDRLFLPLELSTLSTESGKARLGAMGTLHRASGDGGRRLWLQRGPRQVAPLDPPAPVDEQVPPDLQKDLLPLALAWTAGATEAASQLSQLEGHLRTHYAYSLRYRRTPRRDPVLDFLLQHREGHCEYFASAMTLLARSLGIPARVAGGYRVAERNRLGGYQVVRQRNAHAWVEAYVQGQGWVRYDPTPAAALPDDQRHDAASLAALADLLASWWDGVDLWLSAYSPAQISIALGSALVLWLLLRRLRVRPRHKRAHPTVYTPPLASFVRLTRVLAQQGLVRPPAETLEEFARRARAVDEEAGTLIARYAALRYGGEEVEPALDDALSRCAARLARRAPRP